MSENEYFETIELDEADQSALDEILSDAHTATQYSLLRVWSELLSNLEAEAELSIPMGPAGQLTAIWPKLAFQDLDTYSDLYYSYLLEARDVLHEIIQDNPGCMDFEGEEDAEQNRRHYRQLVVDWNVLLDRREMAWRASDPDSHISYAALVDARRFLFDREGLAGHLEARGITFATDEIREEILAARQGVTEEEQSE